MPNWFKRTIPHVIANFQKYQHDHKQSYHSSIHNQLGKSCFVPTDHESFWLHDGFATSKINICPQSKAMVFAELITLKIGPSRYRSYSGFVHPVYESVNKFDYPQLTSICFFASFMNTHLVFNHCFRQLFQDRSNNANNIHPVIALATYMIPKFGSIRAGTGTRFSPSNNTFDIVFLSDKAKGEERLTKVSLALHEWISFLDSNVGKYEAKDTSLALINENMDSVLEKLNAVTGSELDFSKFRLANFTTLVSALGLAEPGEHLRQIVFPVKNTAAYKHLKDPLGGATIREECNISTESEVERFTVEPDLKAIDELMMAMSIKMKWEKYHRDTVEVYLCELMPNQELDKKDLFFVGQTIHDLNDEGMPICREFGKTSSWKPLCRRHIHQLKSEFIQTENNADSSSSSCD